MSDTLETFQGCGFYIEMRQVTLLLLLGQLE